MTILIGAATAAHQIEGNNTNSDFWVLENIENTTYKEPSLDAVDHYNRYKEDITLLKQAGLNAFRFSIEWARIQPNKDAVDLKEIEHYRDVLKYCQSCGITPVVTLHHFSSPKWLISEGGWEDRKTIGYFKKYAGIVMEHLGEYIPYVCTINEANMGVQLNRIIEEFRKQARKMSEKQNDVQVGVNLQHNKRELGAIEASEIFGVAPDKMATFLYPRSEEGQKVIFESHIEARNVIKKFDPNIKVGLTLSLYDYQTVGEYSSLADNLWQEDYGQYLPYLAEDDFIGVQNYTRKLIEGGEILDVPDTAIKTEMGNEFYPHSLANVCRKVSETWHKEILITENGVSSSDDSLREKHIEVVMDDLKAILEAGIPVTGYLHWSLLDNFEWQLGFAQKFGLIEVDRETMERKPKNSLWLLGRLGATLNEQLEEAVTT